MNAIAVAGGTGVVGRTVVAAVRERGVRVTVLSRRTGIDLLTGAGLDQALEGSTAVVDVLNTSTTSARRSVAFFEATTTNLLRAPSVGPASRITSRCRSSAATASTWGTTPASDVRSSSSAPAMFPGRSCARHSSTFRSAVPGGRRSCRANPRGGSPACRTCPRAPAGVSTASHRRNCRPRQGRVVVPRRRGRRRPRSACRGTRPRRHPHGRRWRAGDRGTSAGSWCRPGRPVHPRHRREERRRAAAHRARQRHTRYRAVPCRRAVRVISLTLTGDRIRRIDYVRAPGKLHRA